MKCPHVGYQRRDAIIKKLMERKQGDKTRRFVVKLGETDFVAYEKGAQDFGWGHPTPLSELGDLPPLLAQPKDPNNGRKRKNDQDTPPKKTLEDSGVFSQEDTYSQGATGEGGGRAPPLGGGTRLGIIPDFLLSGTSSGGQFNPKTSQLPGEGEGNQPALQTGSAGTTEQEQVKG